MVYTLLCAETLGGILLPDGLGHLDLTSHSTGIDL